jgi:hypothetical protein
MNYKKLEKLGNFLLITDINSGKEERLPAKDTRYHFENRDSVLVLTWEVEGEDKVFKFDIESLQDFESNSFTLVDLELFLYDFVKADFKEAFPNIIDDISVDGNTGGNALSYYIVPLPRTATYGYFSVFPYVGKAYPEKGKDIKAISTAISAPSLTTGVYVLYIDKINTIIGDGNTTTNTGNSGLNMPDLEYILGAPGAWTLSCSRTSSQFNLPKLKFSSKWITFLITTLPSINLPMLEVVNGTITSTSTAITTVSLPKLLHGGISLTGDAAGLSSLNFPELIVSTSFNISGVKSGLTSISFSKVEQIISAFTFPTLATSLSSFSFGNSLKNMASNFVITSNTLNQESVDHILTTLANLDGSNGTVAYSNKTVTITDAAATPSATGLAAKATLIARGCTVTHN